MTGESPGVIAICEGDLDRSVRDLGSKFQPSKKDGHGSAITLDRVLLVADGAEASIGRPIVPDATVSAEVLRQDRNLLVSSYLGEREAAGA